ncbi:oxidase [Cupriavidus sp. UYMSc13B]|nr:oxidase [Cupriavidus sp. UYMSc13B]
MATRRDFLKSSAGGLFLAGAGQLVGTSAHAALSGLPPELPDGARESAGLEALPGKLPLIKKSYRPPNFETPLSYFQEVFTPNNAFFVRYHLASIPEVNASDWRLKVGGDAAQSQFELTLEQLKKDFEQVELAAVCLCSGNRRGMFLPHVPGVEWGPGAMGNAKWRGVRLRDVLAKAGIKKEAVEVVFDGADGPAIAQTPDFVKSVPAWKAMDENTLIAYEMNNAPLPHWNGYPARIIVPGWTATYWMKHVVSINAVSKPLTGFWMNSAYRIPKGKFPLVDRFVAQETEANMPITEMVVNSLMTSPLPGQRLRIGSAVEVKGIAWDGGYGVSRVEISVDAGQTWRTALLGQDYGRYSFRQFSFGFRARQRGEVTIMARATNRIGATQTLELIHNPAGYHHNVVQSVAVEIV